MSPSLCLCKSTTKVTMSNQECSSQSNSALIPPLDKPERFLQKTSTSSSFATLARRDLGAPAARKGAMLAPQLFADALQALDDFNCHPQQETAKIDLAHVPFDVSLTHHISKRYRRQSFPGLVTSWRRSSRRNIPRPQWKPWWIC